MFKHTEVTQHYSYCSESRCSSCGLMDSDFCTCEEGGGYELVDVCHRESPPLPPQTSELEGDVRGSLGPRFRLLTPPHKPCSSSYYCWM